MPQNGVLAEQDRQKLDKIVSQMEANGESQANIMFVVEDFKQKYSKKKEDGGVDSVSGGNVTPPSSSLSRLESGSQPQPQPQSQGQGLGNVLNPATAIQTTQAAKPMPQPVTPSAIPLGDLQKSPFVRELNPADKFGRKIVRTAPDKVVTVDPRTVPVRAPFSTEANEELYVNAVQDRIAKGTTTKADQAFITKNERPINQFNELDDASLQSLTGQVATTDEERYNQAKALEVRLQAEIREAEINSSEVRGTGNTTSQKIIAEKKEQLEEVDLLVKKLARQMTKVSAVGTGALVRTDESGNLLKAGADWLADNFSLTHILLSDKKNLIDDRVKQLPPEFLTGLNYMKYADKVVAERIARALANGQPISESQIATISHYGLDIEKDQLDEKFAAGGMSQEEYDGKKVALQERSYENLVGNKESLRSFMSSQIAEHLDSVYNEFQTTRPGSFFTGPMSKVFGARWNYSDQDIANAAQVVARANGLDIDDARVKEAVKYLQDNEGAMILQNSISKGGWTRALGKGLAQPIRGIASTVSALSQTDAEQYAAAQSQGNVNIAEQNVKRIEDSWEGKVGQVFEGFGQLVSQVGLGYLGGGAIAGLGRAAIGTVGAEALAAGIPAAEIGTGVRIGQNILKSKDALSTFLTTYATTYGDNKKTALGYTADDTTATITANILTGLESLAEGALSPVGLFKGISKNFLAPKTLAKGIINIVDDVAIANKSAAIKKLVYETVKEPIKIVGTEVGEELVTALGDYAANAYLNPQSQSFQDRDLKEEMLTTAGQTGLTMVIPALVGGVSAANANSFSKGSLLLAAQNTQHFIDDLQVRLHNGEITQDEYNERASLINTAAVANAKIPRKADGTKLNSQEKADYIYSRSSEALLAKQLEDNTDEAEKAIINQKIADQQQFRTKILNNEITYAPTQATEDQVPQTAESQAAQTGTEQGAENATDAGVAEAVITPAAAPGTTAPGTTAAEPTAEETAEDTITVGELIDQQVSFNGQRAIIRKDGNTIIAKIEGKDKEYEIGNEAEVSGQSIKDYGIEQEVSVVGVNDEGNITVRGNVMVNEFSDPLQAINYDKNGNVTGVTLSTTDGKRRTFRGNVGEDVAYQITLKQISDNNETGQLEDFINEDEATREEIVNARPTEAAQEAAATDNQPVSRQTAEKVTVAAPAEAEQPAVKASVARFEKPDMENPVYVVTVGDQKKYIQRIEGANPGDTAWYEVTKENGLWSRPGTETTSGFLGFTKKEAVESFEKTAQPIATKEETAAPATTEAATTPQATVTKENEAQAEDTTGLVPRTGETTITEEVAEPSLEEIGDAGASSSQPKQGDTVTLPPQVKGGIERTMIYDDGQWKQDVGGNPSRVGKIVQDQAQAQFEATIPQATVTKEEAAVPAKTQIEGEVVGTHNGIDLLSINSAEAFHAAISDAMSQREEDRLQADVHPVEKYQQILDDGGQIFLSRDGSFGGYIEADGYMGSLFKNPSSEIKGVANALQRIMLENGGKFFDAYGTHLEDIYIKGNFRPVARLKFNEEYAPEGWENSNLKTKPDVVFFAYDPDGNYKKGDGKYFEDYLEAYTFAEEFKSQGNEERNRSGNEEKDTGTLVQHVATGENVSTEATTEGRDSGKTDEGEGTEQGTSGSPVRQSTVNNSLKTQKFFEDTVNGAHQPLKKWSPLIPFTAATKKVADIWSKFRGYFDTHIETSIPAFRDVQFKKINAIAKLYGKGALMVDLMGSEGGFGKTITSLAPKIKTINLDMSDAMEESHNRLPVKGADFAKAAFGEDVVDDGVLVAKRYVPKEKADVVHESMGFQFIMADRVGFINEVADNYIKDDGVFIVEEKTIPATADEWIAHEDKKDTQFKETYHTKAAIKEKGESVLVGMKGDQAADTELQNALASRFKYVYQYWDAGNFKGYLASNNKQRADKMLAEIGDTTTDFTTRPLVKIVDGRIEPPEAAPTKPKPTKPAPTKPVAAAEPAAATPPTQEQIFEDVNKGNMVTFTYKTEAEVPDALKDRLDKASIGEKNGVKEIRINMSQVEADYLLSQGQIPQATAPVVEEAQVVEQEVEEEVTEEEEVEEEEEEEPEEKIIKPTALGNKIRSLKIDLAKLSGGGLQSNILGIPAALYNATVDTVALAIDGGATLAQAISKAYNKNKLFEHKDFEEDAFIKQLEAATGDTYDYDTLTAKEVAEDVKIGRITLTDATKGKSKDFIDEVKKFITGRKKFNFEIEAFKEEIRKHKEFGIKQDDVTKLLSTARQLTRRQLHAIAEVYAEVSDKEAIEKQLQEAFRDILAGTKPKRVLQKLSVSDASSLVAALDTLNYTAISNESLEKIADQIIASIDINQSDKYLNKIIKSAFFDAKQVLRAKMIVELQKVGNKPLAKQLVQDMADDAISAGRQTQSLTKAYDILNAQGNAETKAAFKRRWAAKVKAIAEAKFKDLSDKLNLKEAEIQKLNERIHNKTQKSSLMSKVKDVITKLCNTRTK